ncbi:MAG: Nramp family divalent metal transporter [Planctomycetes bacterium]|nr:Nramp family divalent metal transporter [Planctomycetota bacterium]
MNHDAPDSAELTEEQKIYREGLRQAQQPPESPLGILRHLGPGLIVAGSIVGSGELIATTKTGAEAGFWLLWLILIGCVIKVFVQVEFGRYAISTGTTTLAAMDEVPGPRVKGRGNWLVWYWLLMFLASLGQLGGIVGGVGQALAISVPLTDDGREFNAYVDTQTRLPVKQAEVNRYQILYADDPANVQVQERLRTLRRELQVIEADVAKLPAAVPTAYDAQLWAAIIAVITAAVLMMGRYGFIQFFATLMVAAFTCVTVVNVAMLQDNEAWRITSREFLMGLQFRLPPTDNWNTALATALATFGIIGVGASELVVYPYWCLEKGYARYTGPRNETKAWANRADGWLRVMRWDAWLSMVVYTFATVAFYLLGASILGRTGLNPGKSDMIRTLSEMYVPVFGEIAQPLFLFGAFAVLYSTYFVANASHARTFSDALRVLGMGATTEHGHRRLVTLFSGVFPLVCLLFFVLFSLVYEEDPAAMVLISGVTQAVMLPMLAGAALYFRYHRIDRRIAPGRLWDIFLWLSAGGMLIAGAWALWTHLAKVIGAS